jgi:peptide/nickel transport system substrate-binding protein
MQTKILALAAALTIALPTGMASAGDVRVGFTQDVLTLDPHNFRGRETETVIRNMYDGLLTRTPDMEVIPELAETWKQVDALTYAFTLRKGVKFHSGDELTMEDVKFTFDRITKEGMMDGKTSPRKSLVGPLKETRIIDKYSGQFIFSKPFPVFPAFIPNNPIVNKKFVEKVGTAGMATQANGTGPFKLVAWRPGDSIIMERFDDYYGGAPGMPPVGKPKADKIIFKVIPENTARVAALLAGEVDIIMQLPPHLMKRVEDNPNTNVLPVKGTRTWYIAMNNNKKPFDDVRVRRAANHALNKKLIIDKVLNGLAVPLKGVVSSQSDFHNPNLPEYAYDPEKAKKLLAEAGYAGGIDATLDAGGPEKELAEAVASQLTKVGIRTKVQIWETAVISKIWRVGFKHVDRVKHDMWMSNWGNLSLDPVGLLQPTMRTMGRGNASGYSNAEVDKQIDAAAVSADKNKRIELYRKAQATVTDAAPWLFLWVTKDVYGGTAKLKGWRPSPDSRINLHDAYVEGR